MRLLVPLCTSDWPAYHKILLVKTKPRRYTVVHGEPSAAVRLLMNGAGDEERTLMHLVPAPAVKPMKRRVLSRPGVDSVMFPRLLPAWSWVASE